MTSGHILLPRDISTGLHSEALTVTVSHCHRIVKINKNKNQPSENLGVADTCFLNKQFLISVEKRFHRDTRNICYLIAYHIFCRILYSIKQNILLNVLHITMIYINVLIYNLYLDIFYIIYITYNITTYSWVYMCVFYICCR